MDNSITKRQINIFLNIRMKKGYFLYMSDTECQRSFVQYSTLHKFGQDILDIQYVKSDAVFLIWRLI